MPSKNKDKHIDHIVLCGLDGLGFRTLEELVLLKEKLTVIVPSLNEPLVIQARSFGVSFIEGNYENEGILRLAGIETARAIVLTSDGDVGNLHAALAAQELNPQIRIVMRMFNQELGEKVAALFTDCLALSSSALAAPSFVSAALHPEWEQQLKVDGRNLVVRRARANDPDILLPLLGTNSAGRLVNFPTRGENILCLATSNMSLHQSIKKNSQRSIRFYFEEFFSYLGNLLKNTSKRLFYLPLILILLITVSTGVFHLFYNLSVIDALYFTASIITTTGLGDINFSGASTGLKLFGVGLMLFGASTLALFYAFITDAIVKARLEKILNRPMNRITDHIIVCGLGSVGYRIVEQLTSLGLPVVAIELNESGRFIPTVRRLGVPIVFTDVRMPEALRAVNIEQARCVVVATDNDLANIETALNARTINPKIRVVLRLFDTDLAARVERAFKIDISRSVAVLAAPAFAAAAIGQRVLSTVPIGQSIFIIAQTGVKAGSPAEGNSIEMLEATVEGRVLILKKDGEAFWRPSPETILHVDHEIIVVTTGPGLPRVLTYTETIA